MSLLLDNASSATQSGWHRWPGGKGQFSTFGTFDTATAKLQAKFSDNGSAIDVVSHTSATVETFTLPPCNVRADLSSTGASTSVSADLSRGRE